MALAGIQRRMAIAAGWPLRAWRRGCPWPDRYAAWCRRSGGIARSEDGGSLIEFALVTTAMMTFIFVVMQLCLAFYSYGMICETAREATRWAALRGSTCQTSSLTSCTTTAAAISTYAKGLRYPNIGGGTLNVDATPGHMFPDRVPVTNALNCQVPSVCRVVVNITYTVPITLPLVPRHAIALSTVSEMFFVQ